MIALALATAVVAWTFGFRRYFRRTLEAEDTPYKPRTWHVRRVLHGDTQQQAIFAFVAKTLARSPKHQFFLAAYLSAGIAIAAIFCIAIP